MNNRKNESPRVSRRDFLKVAGYFGGLSFIAGFWGWKYLNQVEPEKLELVELPLKLPRLAPAFKGLKIAVIGDIHLGGWMTHERLISAIDMILEQSPDIILHTGDFLAGHGWTAEHIGHLENLKIEFKRLSAKSLNIAIMGNHDHWTNSRAIRIALKEANIIELSNTFYTFERGTAQLHFCGIDDVWEEHDDLNALLTHLPAENSAILLVHEPDFADISAATKRFDLQISGHTHGGQVVIPGYGMPVLPHLGQNYPSGLYKISEMWQYTNRGIGLGRIPIRYNCRPEITLFTLS